MNPVVGLIVAGVVVPLIPWACGKYLLLPKIEKTKNEVQRAAKILSDYKNANPLIDNVAQDTTAQAKLIRALDDELQDTKQRVAMLTFKMNAAGSRRPTPEPSPRWEARNPRTFDVEPEIISPRPSPATPSHSDVAGDLYDDE